MTRKIFLYYFFGVFSLFCSPRSSSSEDGFWQESPSPPPTPLKKPPLLPQVKLVPGGMFLCWGATSPSYLPVISVGRQGTTLSLAPEPQASSKGQNHRCTLRSLLWEEGLFGVCQSFFSSRIEQNKRQVKSYTKCFLYINSSAYVSASTEVQTWGGRLVIDRWPLADGKFLVWHMKASSGYL